MFQQMTGIVVSDVSVNTYFRWTELNRKQQRIREKAAEQLSFVLITNNATRLGKRCDKKYEKWREINSRIYWTLQATSFFFGFETWLEDKGLEGAKSFQPEKLSLHSKFMSETFVQLDLRNAFESMIQNWELDLQK